jgi:LacI family transcriptional regulator, fructose operon transcriptional repressor
MPSILDVAKQAGVSVATVSRVLADKPHVRPEVREHVLKIVKEIGYRPNRIAMSLRRQTSSVLGLLVSDIRNPFFTAMARAIEDVAMSQKISLFLCNTDEDPEKERLYLNTLLDENVAGIILSPTQDTPHAYQFLLESDTPVVMIDRRIDGAQIDSVISNNLESSLAITTHLIESGYQRIGGVFGLKNSSTGRSRMQGYKLALSEHNLPFELSIATYVYPREAEGEKVVSQWLASKNRPDAILTGNSRLTIGAMNAISKAGLSIPHDIGLAGFDETDWMPHAGPGITVVSQPTYEMGKTAAELMFQRIADPSRPTRDVILNGSLIKRASTPQK